MSESNSVETVQKVLAALSTVRIRDVQRLALIHGDLERVGRWVYAQDRPDLVSVAISAANLLEQIILEEVAEPERALALVRQSVHELERELRGMIGSDAREEGAPAPPPPREEPPPDREACVCGPSGPACPDASAWPDLLADFVFEACEHLDRANLHLLTLETKPGDTDALNAVFRALHTVKGTSGMLGLGEIARLAHSTEHLLDRVRKGECTLAPPVLDVLFDAVDQLRRMTEMAPELDAEGSAAEAISAIEARLNACVGSPSVVEPPAPPEDFTDAPERLGELLIAMGVVSTEDVAGAARQLNRPVGAKKLGEILGDLNFVSSLQIRKALEYQAQHPNTRLGDILVKFGFIRAEDVQLALDRQQQGKVASTLGEVLVREGKAPAKAVAHALRRQQMLARMREKTRVDTRDIETLVALSRELVEVDAELAALRRAKSRSRKVGALQLQISALAGELHACAVRLQYTRADDLLEPMRSVVRDTAAQAGKEVELAAEGGEVFVNKRIAYRARDTLAHMLRNAVDHGIEPSADRVAAGKSPVGKISLRVYTEAPSLCFDVEDDGRGLDRNRILAHALELNLIADGAALSDEEVWRLILQPGFSTASTVTTVSGRGVGLDAVRAEVEALGGTIDIQTEPGKGTRFTVRFPDAPVRGDRQRAE